MRGKTREGVNDMDFEVGDVVVLKSGGPKMTVVDFAKSFAGEYPVVGCRWFDKNEKKIGSFPPDTLEKAKD
jgi:uncharacterized protein YodC (DUF2158 family)